MTLYIDGYKDGCNSHTWCASLFLLRNHDLPINEKINHKQLTQAGFNDWLGKAAPKLDYYMLRYY